MARLGGRALLPAVLLLFVLAACGGTSRSSSARTVTFASAGAFPAETIVGTYSVHGCKVDARKVVHNARLFYQHTNGGLGPADLYYYDLRFAYAHFEADGCTSGQLGDAMERGLTAQQRRFLLRNVDAKLERVFRAALSPA